MLVLEQIRSFFVDVAETLFVQIFFSSIFVVWGVSLLPFSKISFKWKTVIALTLILFGLHGVFGK